MPAQNAKHASWAYAEEHLPEDELFAEARQAAVDLGVPSPSEGTLALLTTLAAIGPARGIVEIGTGVGLSGTALLRGAAKDAVLTGIDADSDAVSIARRLFRSEPIAAAKTRLITGKATEVLPRLTTAGYDLVHIGAGVDEVEFYAQQGLRLLKPAGILVISDALAGDRVVKPAVRDPEVQALRAVERSLREDQRTVTSLLPTGTGVLVAVKQSRQ